MATGPAARTKALFPPPWRIAVTERWNPHAGIRQDLFGWIDLLAYHPARLGVVGVQATTTGNLAARVAKMQGVDGFAEWLAAGNGALAVGWAKRGPRGKRKLWTPRILWVAEERVDEVRDILHGGLAE